MEPNASSVPSRFRRTAGAVSGIGTTLIIYGGESYLGYAIIDTVRAGFQSPDTLSSTVSALCAIGLIVLVLSDAFANRGENIKAVLLSGVRAGYAINRAVIESQPLNS